MFYGGCQDGVGGHFPGTISHKPPEAGFHGLQTAMDEPGKALGGFRTPGLKHILIQYRRVPAPFVNAMEKQISADPAL